MMQDSRLTLLEEELRSIQASKKVYKESGMYEWLSKLRDIEKKLLLELNELKETQTKSNS